MELRLPTNEQLRTVYEQEMKEAFPAAELKPLPAIERMWKDGWYKPYCLFDGDTILGTAFLWMGHPGWAVLDYLCVAVHTRSGGLGSEILRRLWEAEPELVIFGEVEIPEYASSPDMARRRLGFYARNGLRTAGYDTEIFGVRYKTLYYASRDLEDERLMAEHRFVYQNAFTAEKYAKYVRIPVDLGEKPGQQTPWDQ